MKYLYGFILLFLATCAFNTSASQIVGGDFWYRYIGDLSGIENQYEIYLRLYRDASGAHMPTSVNIEICSSCALGAVVPLNFVAGGPGVAPPSLFGCVNQAAPGTVELEYYVYKTTYTLPGECIDWKFTYESCCRNGQIENLFQPSGAGILIQAELNNLIENNSSSQFGDLHFRAVASNYPVNISFEANNPDGDSLYYFLTEPKQGSSSPCGSFLPLTYAMGYSSQQPMSVQAGTQAVFENANGLFQVTPNAIGIYQVAVGVAEFKYDAQTQSWYKAGLIYTDALIMVSSNLSNAAQLGAVWTSNNSGIGYNALTNQYSLDAACGDSAIFLTYYNPIDCRTIAADASDFWILDPDNTPLPLIAAETQCQNSNTQNIILRTAFFGFKKNGRHVLRHKVGNDNNTIGTNCGMYASVADSLIINVTGCSGIGLDESINTVSITLAPNPASNQIWFNTQANEKASIPYMLYSTTGLMLQKGESDGLSIGHLPAGVYVIHLRQNNTWVARRFVKRDY